MDTGTKQRGPRRGSRHTNGTRSHRFHPHNHLILTPVKPGPTKSKLKYFATGDETGNIKITKRTHFRIFDLPANKGVYVQSVPNLSQKRTHFPLESICRTASWISRRTVTVLGSVKVSQGGSNRPVVKIKVSARRLAKDHPRGAILRLTHMAKAG